MARARESMDYAEAGLTLAEQAGDPDILAGNLAGVAELTFWRTGRMRRDLLDRAVEIEHDVGRDLDARGTLARLLARCDRHAEARALFAPLIGAARTRDGPELLGHLFFLARMELAAGDWPTTERLCDEAITVAGHTGEESAESLCRMLLAELDAYRGRAATARREIPALRRLAEESGYTGAVHRLSRALGSLELAGDDSAEGLRQVRPLCVGFTELNEVQAQLAGSVAIEAMVGVQDIAGAERLLAQLDEIAAGADSPLQVLADRSRGHVLAAQGDTSGAIRAFERAVVAPDPPQGREPPRVRQDPARARDDAAPRSAQASSTRHPAPGGRRLRATRCLDVGRQGPFRAQTDRRAHRLRPRALRDRAADRGPRRGRAAQPGGGRRPAPEREHGVLEPVQNLPKARRHLAYGARGTPGSDATVVKPHVRTVDGHELSSHRVRDGARLSMRRAT